MSLSRSTIGSPATWNIGAAGQPQDHYPARTIDSPRLSQLNGRMVEVVTIIAYRTNQAGEPYTSERLVNTRFLDDRNVRCEALDGTKEAPMTIADLKAAHAASVAAFQGAATAELSLDALAAMVD